MNRDQSSSPKPEPPAGAEGDGLNLENQPVPAGSKWMARFKRFFPAPFLAAGLLFGGLFALGFPKPFCDDLYFIGAGLNLANGGDFSNPFLERSQFPEPHHYFGHPPMLSYAVAGWLKLFGISARSLMSFQMLTAPFSTVTGMAAAPGRGRGFSHLWLSGGGFGGGADPGRLGLD